MHPGLINVIYTGVWHFDMCLGKAERDISGYNSSALYNTATIAKEDSLFSEWQ